MWTVLEGARAHEEILLYMHVVTCASLRSRSIACRAMFVQNMPVRDQPSFLPFGISASPPLDGPTNHKNGAGVEGMPNLKVLVGICLTRCCLAPFVWLALSSSSWFVDSSIFTAETCSTSTGDLSPTKTFFAIWSAAIKPELLLRRSATIDCEPSMLERRR